MNKSAEGPPFPKGSNNRVKKLIQRFIEGSPRPGPGEAEEGEIAVSSPEPAPGATTEGGIEEIFSPDPEPAFELEEEGESPASISEEDVVPLEDTQDSGETWPLLSEAEAQELRDRPLGEILLTLSSLERGQLEEGLSVQEEKGGRLGDILVKLGYVHESQVLYALSLQLGIPFLREVAVEDVDPELCSTLPIHFAKKHGILPIKRDGDGVLVATSNPLDVYPLDDVRILLDQEVKPVVMPPRTIIDSINQVYDRDSNAAQQIIEDFDQESLSIITSALEEPTDLLDASDEAPVIRLVNSVLYQAVKQRASDVHIEPFERDLVVRYRVDGILYNVLTPPKRIQPSVTSRVKIMAGLNIAEKRLPQDGRIRVTIAGKDIDIRVSVIPTAHGERIVMRLLDKTSVLLKLEDIGFSSDQLRIYDRLIHRPHGIILLTGPTGSGKTTTLYAALTKINSPDKNIITVEDPIEYQIRGVGQIQVNPKINLTFANGLRSILRQDPDVIMVGEVRDLETAEIAIQASLTGHLVFSTLHTNDSAGAITRLIDMGIEPFLASSSLIAIMAQRLVRIVCPSCRQRYSPSEEELREIGIDSKGAVTKTAYRANGCENCLGTGYRGRTGIYEVLPITEAVKKQIGPECSSEALGDLARREGMITLRENAVKKLLDGETTYQEVLRVTWEPTQG